MTKLAKAAQVVFGSTVAGATGQTGIAQFGSFAAGSPTYSNDPATIQGLTGYRQGWAGATVNNGVPLIEDENALFYLVTRQLAYLMQAGVAEWDAGTTYYIGSIVNDALGNFYRSLTDGNINHAVSDTTNWQRSILTPGVIPGYIPASTTDKAATGNAGEYIESLGSGGGTSLTATEYSDAGCAPINLGPGEWDLIASGYFLPTAGATVSAVQVAIGTVTGNNSTGIDATRCLTQITWAAEVLPSSGITIWTPPRRVLVATGTTQNYYPKLKSTFATQAMTGIGNLFARRVCR